MILHVGRTCLRLAGPQHVRGHQLRRQLHLLSITPPRGNRGGPLAASNRSRRWMFTAASSRQARSGTPPRSQCKTIFSLIFREATARAWIMRPGLIFWAMISVTWLLIRLLMRAWIGPRVPTFPLLEIWLTWAVAIIFLEGCPNIANMYQCNCGCFGSISCQIHLDDSNSTTLIPTKPWAFGFKCALRDCDSWIVYVSPLSTNIHTLGCKVSTVTTSRLGINTY